MFSFHILHFSCIYCISITTNYWPTSRDQTVTTNTSITFNYYPYSWLRPDYFDRERERGRERQSSRLWVSDSESEWLGVIPSLSTWLGSTSARLLTSPSVPPSLSPSQSRWPAGGPSQSSQLGVSNSESEWVTPSLSTWSSYITISIMCTLLKSAAPPFQRLPFTRCCPSRLRRMVNALRLQGKVLPWRMHLH